MEFEEHYEIGEEYYMKDYDSAINIFKNLINSCPEAERPMFNLGRVFLKQDKLQDALSCFEKAISLNPSNEDAYYYLGVYNEKIGDFKQARACYEKSLSLNFEQSETHLNLGICYYRLNLYKEALSHKINMLIKCLEIYNQN